MAVKTTFEQNIETITGKLVEVIFTPIIWLMGGAALIYFFYGLTIFILNSNGSAKETGKTHMIWGLIGLFIIFAVWGIVALVGGTVQSFA